MDLKIEEVADLLNVPVPMIHRWLDAGHIPAYRIGEQYLFSREEIETWVMNRKKEEPSPVVIKPFEPLRRDTVPPVKKGGIQRFSLYRAMNNGEVLVDVPGKSKEEIIRHTMEVMAPSLDLDADVLTELLLDRESLMPTAIDHGLAIPHARDFLLQAHFDVVTVVFPEEPVAYGALDGEPVHTLFFLFACEDKRHLHLLSKIAHLSRQESSRAFLRTKPNKELLLDYVKQWESHPLEPMENSLST